MRHTGIRRQQSEHTRTRTCASTCDTRLSLVSMCVWRPISVVVQVWLPQCVVGFFALFVFAVFTLSRITFRMYVNQQYKSRGWPQFISIVQYGLIIGSGAIYYYVAEEENIPVLCIFLPPMVYLLVGLYSQWVKNDFHIILPSSHRTPPKANLCAALARCGLPGNDYFMVTGILCEVALIICLGFGLSWYISPWWVGAIVSWVLVVVITTITPLVEYFHTFEFSLNMFVMTGVSLASYFIGLILIFIIVLDGESSQSSFMLLLAGFLYPITITFVVGISKWRDDDWVISEFVVWTNFIAGMLMILLFFSIALVFTPWWIGGGLMFAFVCAIMAVMILPKMKELSPLWYKIICTIACVMVFGFVVGSTLHDSSGFVGFTVLCAICLLAMLGVVYYAYRGSPYDSISIHKHKLVIYSEYIFPIYEFDTMCKGDSTPLVEVNHRVWSIYALFGISYVWGVFALFFQSPTTVGLCVSSLAIAGAAIFTYELMHRSRVRNAQLAEAIDYLEEGSKAYHEVLAQCKWIATKKQLLTSTSILVHTKQNRMIADIGIPVEALTPGSVESQTHQAIIHHIEHIYAHEDWRSTYDKYTSLVASLPPLSWCGIRSEFSFSFDGARVSRREAFRRADQLFLDSAAFYTRAMLYEINLQQEIIKAVEGRQYDRMTQIIAMMREAGNFTLTMGYLQSDSDAHTVDGMARRSIGVGGWITFLTVCVVSLCCLSLCFLFRSLSPLSSEMQQYEIEVDLWMEKRARIIAEAARVKSDTKTKTKTNKTEHRRETNSNRTHSCYIGLRLCACVHVHVCLCALFVVSL